MTSTFHGINTSLRGLLAQQRALDVTSHNIANADRAGYTRQEAVLAGAPAVHLPLGSLQDGAGAFLGSGVEVQAYRRIRDDFLDLQWRAQNMSLGYDEATAQRLGQAEDVLGEGTPGSLGALLDRFWSSWQDLANNPESGSAKAAVLGAAQTLAGRFNALDADLSSLTANIAAEYNGLVGGAGPVQAAATEIARLNASITQAVQAGQQPNDLLDRRDELIDNLSKLGQVSVTDLGNGTLRVNFGDAAQPLVDDTTVTWPQALTAATGGRLGALLTASQTTIPGYRAALDAMASQVATAVNGAHPTAVFSGATAASLAVVATPGSITAGSSGAAGDNAVARAIGALRGGAIDQAYATFLTQVGSDVAAAQGGQATSEAVLGAVSDRRAAVAGVSMDEEMTNMVRFQRGYQAAARAMSTMDDMLDTLINRTGRVGL
ncbi:MAG: flagellar hook-associated protein FlgK [Solirubrobacterales bacterium]|nr:flagellar hook-associated protein FlgK [Solirubrobacterales bacterium]